VPAGSVADLTSIIERQVERFAPGFGDRILARHVMNTSALEEYNGSLVGGAITGGVTDWKQLFARPTLRLSPYTTPNPRVFLCSASTPPGGGVHGMCGYHAAQAALHRIDTFRSSPLT
jgi:phytoene dehydrogenase-like protein